MNEFADTIKENLLDLIDTLNDSFWLYTKSPEKDFTRKRKLDFKEMLRIILSMGGQSLSLELLEYFLYNEKTVTKSGFIQQREKILPEAFELLFHMFSDIVPEERLFMGHRLLAADGSALCVQFDPTDFDNHFPNGEKAKGFNLLHLNALYDLRSRIYVDSIVQPGRKAAECRSLSKMVDRSNITGKVIVIADRAYENYNVMDHMSRKGWDFVIRAKDLGSTGIASSLDLPTSETFDIDYKFLMTRRQTKEIKQSQQKYKFLPQNLIFDELPPGSKQAYPFHFRILRFPITDSTFEVIITTLDRKAFPAEKIKEIYSMRWGIETSFRELKYAIGLTNFHSKKVTYILQEIYARLIMYNFCEMITVHVIIKQTDRKHSYQVNFTIAIAICLRYFRFQNDMPPPNVEALIRMNILPVRPGRKDPRKVRIQSQVSFLYRVA